MKIIPTLFPALSSHFLPRVGLQGLKKKMARKLKEILLEPSLIPAVLVLSFPVRSQGRKWIPKHSRKHREACESQCSGYYDSQQLFDFATPSAHTPPTSTHLSDLWSARLSSSLFLIPLF